MIKSNLFFSNYTLIFRKNLKALSIIDIMVFTVFINSNYFSFIPNPVRLSISIFLIQKPMLKLDYTKFIEPVFIVFGGRIKKIVMINWFINNFIFSILSILLIIMNITSFAKVCENVFVLNTLICISFLIKFVFPLNNINNLHIRKIIKFSLYYTSIGLLSTISFNPFNMIVLIGLFIFLTHKFNRTFNAYDSY